MRQTQHEPRAQTAAGDLDRPAVRGNDATECNFYAQTVVAVVPGEGESMRLAGAGLIAAVLALAGCRSTDSQPGDRTPGGIASRLKGKGKDKDKDKDANSTKDAPAKTPNWLDDVAKMPGATTGVPKAGAWTNPGDPNFNAKNEAQDSLGGRVLDPNGKPARNVFVRIDPVGSAPDGTAAIGIYTDQNGYFFTRGLKPGKAYELTAEATQDGKSLTGAVQTKVPNPILTIVLRDDRPPVGGPQPPRGEDTGFPPAPKPTDNIPPMGGLVPVTPPRPADGAWTPGTGGSGGTSGVPPASIGSAPGGSAPSTGSAPGGGIPPPEVPLPSLTPKPSKPENVAEGKEPFKPPVVNVPNPKGAPTP